MQCQISVRKRNKPRGIILLVVLSSLTFFSILIAAYLVFSSQAQQSAFALSTRNVRAPDANGLMEDALMTIIRGTSDTNNPFYGEDLLSDYYGRTDYLLLMVQPRPMAITPPLPASPLPATPVVDNGFLRITVVDQAPPPVLMPPPLSLSSPGLPQIDDLLSGRIVTFTSGVLENRSYRVLRSISEGGGRHDLIIQRDRDLNTAAVLASLSTQTLRVNGVPHSSRGLGFDGTNLNQSMSATGLVQRFVTSGSEIGITTLPVALQPNHLPGSTVLVNKAAMTGDFDEDYDVADYLNWFLSHRDANGVVTPSFHRPAVLNYILNEEDYSDSAPDYVPVIASLARGTMRPIPLSENQVGTNSPALNIQFSGGNQNFALRTALRIPLLSPPPDPDPNAARDAANRRLNQLAQALIEGPWDVDNDSDGVPDSIWINPGLPLVTAADGKLLRPLIAPMIEDLSGRLNVNAHGNYATIELQNGLVHSAAASLAGSVGTATVFRGLGYGPAEINIPLPVSAGTAQLNALASLIQNRYGTSNTVPGALGIDQVSLLESVRQPRLLNINSVYSSTPDPYGRSGLAISAAGTIDFNNMGTALTDLASTTVVEPNTDVVVDNPYEFDPTGQLSGDSAYTLSELETLLRANDFDSDTLPGRLRETLAPILSTNPNFVHSLTTLSKSFAGPASLQTPSSSPASPYLALRNAISTTLTDAQSKALIAPELRLGRLMDVNRAFGNGIDDNGNGVVDEPRELFLAGIDDDGDGAVDEADEVSTELQAYGSNAGLSASGFQIDANMSPPAPGQINPNYDFDELTSVSGRQLFARHLYVLMMTVSNGLSGVFPSFGDTLATAVPVSDRERYRARRLAQWAINVVDFRDPDSIMTPFEYDEIVSDGWDVDGDLTTTGEPTRGVVWGVEQPELIFSESLALHDVRVRDTEHDVTGEQKGTSGMPNPDDDDTDQVRVPQGSLFLELYCPRRNVAAQTADITSAGLPRELYDVVSAPPNATYVLDLDRTVETRFDGTNYGTGTDIFRTPVWRVAISEPHSSGFASANANSPLMRRELFPDTLSFQPERLDELTSNAADVLTLQRFVLFQNYPLITDLQRAILPIPDITDQAQVFFNNSTTNPVLNAEQYLTLCPRVTTHLGSTAFAAAGAGPTNPSPQRFSIETAANATGLIHHNLAGTQTTPDTSVAILPGNAIVMAGFAPPGWVAPVATRIGMNVSEPLASTALNYYALPTSRYTTNGGGYPLTDAYVEYDAGGLPATASLPLDQPEDMLPGRPIGDLTRAAVPAAEIATVADPALGTVNNYCTAFLQRLADPTTGFHPVLNPYMTVDQIAVDLTVFSGEELPSEVTEQGEMPSTPTVEGTYAIITRQRNGIASNGVGAGVLYSYSTNDPDSTSTPLTATTPRYFEQPFDNTFNFLNVGFGVPQVGINRGRPTNAFAMQPWLNRPFASPMELMLVPAVSSGRLFEEFSVVDPLTPNPVIYPDGMPVGSAPFAQALIGPYRHLLNFFHDSAFNSTSPVPAANFGDIFGLVETAHGFRGETEYFRPSGLPIGLSPLMSAPFSFTRADTRVGRVNLNTLSQFPVWQGLMQGHLNPDEYTNPNGGTGATQLSFDNFVASRRGYTPSGTSAEVTVGAGPYLYSENTLDPRFPTQFAGLYRRSVMAEYAPNLRDAANANLYRRRGVNATVMRGSGPTGTAGTLEIVDPTGGTPTTSSLAVRDPMQQPIASAAPYLDRSRNPMTRYQTLMRMPNLTSDNSQIYLIRLTMGLFEVDPNNVNSLGREYGADTGENERFKATFIIDRSIPVGFVPGEDLNARDVVIYESYEQ